MTLHKEGKGLLVSIGVILVAFNLFAFALGGAYFWTYLLLGLSLIIYALILNFFRYTPLFHPNAQDNDIVVSSVDGRVVVVEEVDEQEILEQRCIQVSVFMNVFNIHVQWMPVNGKVEHVSHHEGRFMSAHLPKASTDNERSAVVQRTADGHQVLTRQIAGAIAQRIVTYPKVGDMGRINDNLGFIKFGSRVDIYLPLGSEVFVKVGDKVKGNITVLARLPHTITNPDPARQ